MRKSYIFGGSTGETAESIARKRRLAAAIQPRGVARNAGEGIAALGSALAGAALDWRANRDERALAEQQAARTAAANEEYERIISALASPRRAPQPERAPQFEQTALPPPEKSPNYRDAIASIESAGSGDYSAIGPRTRTGDRAYGRYQVMGANVGPWTQQVLGRKMTPEEFLADQAAQDKVFDAIFGGYVEQYGNPQDAASMWFSGRPVAKAGNRSDGMTTVPEYIEKFNRALQTVPYSTFTQQAPQAPQAPQMAPQAPQVASGGLNPDILRALGNPDINEGQRAVLNALMQRSMQVPEQMTPYQREQLRLREEEMDFRRQQSGAQQRFEILTPEEVKAIPGLDPNKAYQRGADGKITPVSGGGVTVSVGENQKLTESQSKDLGFYARGKYANATLEDLESELTKLDERLIADYGGIAGNYYLSPENRMARNAGANFLAIILRKDTGAAVTDHEFRFYTPMFLPAPGDDARVLEQKREARRIAIEGIRLGLGTASNLADDVDAKFLEREAERKKRIAGAPTVAAPSAPVTIDGYTIEQVD